MKNPLSRSDVGAAVAKGRSAANLTQEQLGKSTGLGQAIISRIEAGARKLDFIEIVAIADALGVEVAELLRNAQETAAYRTGDSPTPNYQVLAYRLREQYASRAPTLSWLGPFLSRWEELERFAADD